jgi:3'(2'), 5'-bisphosphate nucleotidase
MNIQNLAHDVVAIAKEAGDAIMLIYKDNNYTIEIKSDDSPVTIADKKANDIIVKKLLALTPHIPIISEESQQLSYAERRDFDYFWLVDPLDGTKEFIAGNGDFAVNIALVKKDKPVLGVIYVPNTEGVYVGIKNKGSYKIEGAERTDLQCNTFKITDIGLRIPVSRSYFNEATKVLIAQSYKEPILIPRGSALKFMNIAEGSADIYPRIGKTMEWDTAACQIIIEEAGGQLLKMDDRKPLLYNKISLFNPDFIALGKVRN